MNYKILNATQLDDDLTVVADAIRTRTGINNQLSFPAGYVEAINNIPASVNVQKASGTFDVAIDDYYEVDISSISVNCGFAPDVIYILRREYETESNQVALLLSEGGSEITYDGETYDAVALLYVSYGTTYDAIYAKKTDTGFILKYYNFLRDRYYDLTYIAVKYT